jgi:regulator of RNase E activity RraA
MNEENDMTLATSELLQHLTRFETALIANTVGMIDATPVHEWYMGGSIQSVTPELGPTVGVAYTIELDSGTPGGTASVEDYWRTLEEMQKDGRPSVWVVRTVGARPDHECTLGDGMARSLLGVGCRGVVTDGGVRDVPGLLGVGFAAYSRGKTIHHGPLRFRAAGTPIEIGGITVRPGDVIHADSGGVIRIPSGCLERLPGEAARMVEFEREAFEVLVRTDVPLTEQRRGIEQLVARYAFQRG